MRRGEAAAEQRRGEGGRPGGWRDVVEDVGEDLNHAGIGWCGHGASVAGYGPARQWRHQGRRQGSPEYAPAVWFERVGVN